MKCAFIITYPHSKEAAIQKLTDAVLSRAGIFKGDSTQGYFRVNTRVGIFEVKYMIDKDDITVNVLKKPVLISWKRIEKEVREYLENSAVMVSTAV